jgi:thymidylate synthase
MIASKILNEGAGATYDAQPIRELIMPTLHIASPKSDDELINRHADPERVAWMHANFTDPARVAALGDADSYATRLYDYEHKGLNQINWVADRLRRDPTSRSATITTFQPLTDTTYIPCVSLLDFFLDEGRLALVVYAHSIDFGTKGFANLVELAYLQESVGTMISSDIGTLTMIIKSAHVYENDVEDMARVLSSQRAPA